MLDGDTKAKVNAAAKEIRGDYTFYSVGRVVGKPRLPADARRRR